MAKKRTGKVTAEPANDQDESAGVKASLRRKAVRTASELAAQADQLRHIAVGLDQYGDELKGKRIRSFEMDGATKFDRAHKLLTDYLVQVNRWIGAAEHR